MRTRRFIFAVISLCVYLGWICGYCAVVLTCHCQAAEHICCCSKCQAQDESLDFLHFSPDSHCRCLHSHSTEIPLYDISKKTCEFSPLSEQFTSASFEIQIPLRTAVPFKAGNFTPRYAPPYIFHFALRAPPVMA